MSTRIKWTTDLVAKEMLKENCILLSKYVNVDTKLEYEYQGKKYSVRWRDWMSKKHPVRKHLFDPSKKSKHYEKWSTAKVKELLAKENCIILSEYHSLNQKLKYKFNNLIYFTTISRWFYHRDRVHLNMSPSEIPFHKFLNECEVEFEMQKSFPDLRSKNNRVLKFDFYLPEYNVLIEIDGPEHFNKSRSQATDQQKEEYCIKNNIKLFRFDISSTFEEYLKIYDEPSSLINKFYH